MLDLHGPVKTELSGSPYLFLPFAFCPWGGPKAVGGTSNFSLLRPGGPPGEGLMLAFSPPHSQKTLAFFNPTGGSAGPPKAAASTRLPQRLSQPPDL